jgi:hypothetical protein
MFSIETGNFGETKKVEQCMTGIKQLAFLLDQVLRTSRMLTLNMTTIQRMIRAARRYEVDQDCCSKFVRCAEDVHQEYEYLQLMANSILERGKNLSHQVCGSLVMAYQDES